MLLHHPKPQNQPLLKTKSKGSFVEIIAWILAFGLGGAFFGTTKADIVDHSYDKLYTLEYYTTPYGAEFFSFAFERTAEQLCPKGYEIVDRTNQEKDHKKSRTKWLIECTDVHKENPVEGK